MGTDRGRTGRRLLLAALLAGAPGIARAQTDVEVNAAVEFNFSTPGARSLAMGGAFVGLADDATAAFTNPAGLIVLSKAEVSAEYRHDRTTTRFVDRGHAFGPPSGEGLDTIAGIQLGEAKSRADDLSFVSYVWPSDSWAIAGYRQQLAKLATGFRTQGVFSGPADDLIRFFPVIANLDLEIANYGVSGAAKLNSHFSLGASVSYYVFRLDSSTVRFDTAEFAGPSDFLPGQVVNRQILHGADYDVALNLGLLWKITDRLSLGGVYREGPTFKFNGRNVGPGGAVFSRRNATFHVPDVYGLGLTVKPTDAFTLSADYDRVVYGKLTESVVTLFALDDCSAEADPAACAADNASEQAAASRLRAKDADEAHLGAEYVFSRLRWPIALRAGFAYDPAHRIFQPDGDRATNPYDQDKATLFRKGENSYHGSGGAGIVIGKHFQLDGAFSFSNRLDVFSLSSVVRF